MSGRKRDRLGEFFGPNVANLANGKQFEPRREQPVEPDALVGGQTAERAPYVLVDRHAPRSQNMLERCVPRESLDRGAQLADAARRLDAL